MKSNRTKDALIISFCVCDQDAIKSMESSLAEVNAAVSKLEGEETLIRKDQIEIQHRYEKYDAVVKENHEKNKHWKKEVWHLLPSDLCM